jgi:hypothetical protein
MPIMYGYFGAIGSTLRAEILAQNRRKILSFLSRALSHRNIARQPLPPNPAASRPGPCLTIHVLDAYMICRSLP